MLSIIAGATFREAVRSRTFLLLLVIYTVGVLMSRIVGWVSATDGNLVTTDLVLSLQSVIGVLVTGGQATITNCIITGNGVGIVTLGGTATVHDSNLAGNWIDAFQNYTSTTMNAEGNWWGSNRERQIRNEIFGLVDYSPWLSNGIDHDGGARGFDG